MEPHSSFRTRLAAAAGEGKEGDDAAERLGPKEIGDDQTLADTPNGGRRLHGGKAWRFAREGPLTRLVEGMPEWSCAAIRLGPIPWLACSIIAHHIRH